MMTSNHILPRVTAGLSAAFSQPFHAGSLAAGAFDFKKSDKILWVDRLTVALTPGSISALQTPAKRRIFMPEVIVRKGEPIDRALKRLKNKLDAEGIMEEVRRLRAFETPSQKLRRKAKLAAKRGKLKFRFNP
jgi:small subunit ribosomal protein S21